MWLLKAGDPLTEVIFISRFDVYAKRYIKLQTQRNKNRFNNALRVDQYACIDTVVLYI